MSILQNSNAISASAGGDFYDHQIANSCRFIGSANDDGTNYMYHVQGTPTNADKCTISAWVKRSNLGSKVLMFTGSGLYGGNYSWYGFNSDSVFWHLQGGGNNLKSNAVYRDSGGWYHVVISNDSSQGTAANRVKIYINGEQITSFTTETYLSQNADFAINTSGYRIFVGSGGASEANSWLPFDGYIAEYVFIDGTAYAPSDFAETKNGAWIPKDPSGLTFGNNGAYLKFESSGDLGNDSSGNNNDFTVSNVSAHDQMTDSPSFNSSSNGGNFCTYNFLNKGTSNNLSEGNLQTSGSAGGNVSGTMAFLTGKWYWEQKAQTLSAYGPTFGIGQLGSTGNASVAGGIYNIITWQSQAGQMYGGGGYPAGMGTITVTSTGVTSLSSGDVMGFWLDLDNNKLWITKNGAFINSGNPATGANPQASWASTGTQPMTLTTQNVSSGVAILNTGSNPSFNGTQTAGTATDKNGYGLFKYDPSGTDFIAMCSANLPTADAISPAETSDSYPQKLFSPILYTGNGGTNNITGLGFKPDWLLIKIRNTASNAVTVDSTRGTNKVLFPTHNGAEYTSANVTAFGTDGFSLDGTSDNLANFNGNNNTYVAWSWRANGSNTSSNSNGSITSTVQVDPSGGFSIVTWTGVAGAWGTLGTVGHGLSASPTVIFAKTRGSGEWCCFFSDYGRASIGGSNAASNKLQLDVLNALYTNQSYADFGKVMPTSTVFTVNGNLINNSGTTVVAYCFTNVEGFIKSGTYTGTGTSGDGGAFVWCGFRPSIVITKMIDGGAEWSVYDDKRDTGNVSEHLLQIDLHDAERTDLDEIDILSNGFKCRSNGGRTNQNNKNYVFLAFASNPFAFATAR